MDFRKLLFLLLCATPVFAQGVPYENILITASGPSGSLVPVTTATITVCAGVHAEIPCTPAVTIYSDVALSVPITPPLTTGPLGNYRFVLAPGTYSVSFTGAGISTPNDVIVLPVGTASSVTQSGNNAFTGNNTASSLNGIIAVDGTRYACSSTGVNAAVTAQIALGGGTVDMRGCPNMTTTAEIDCGSAAGTAITCLMPNSGLWAVNITNGTSCGLKVFNNSSMIGSSASFSSFQIQPAGSSTNVSALICNDTTVANAHIRVEGFEANIFAGTATMVNAVGYFTGLGDGSFVGHMTFGNLSSTNATKVLWVNNSCCATTFEDIVVDAFAVSGVTPCWFGNGVTGPNLNIKVDGISCTHMGSGANDVVDQEWNQFGGNTFKNVYMENLTGADTTSAWISIQKFGTPTAADNFIGVVAGGDVTSSTRYLFDIANGAHAVIVSAQQGNVSTNAINDHNSGGILTTAPINTTIGGYSTEKQLINGSLAVTHLNQITTGQLGGTCTLSGTPGTCTFSYAGAFTSAPLCYVTWNGTGTLTGILKAVPGTGSCVVTSSANDTGVIQVLVIGNPN